MRLVKLTRWQWFGIFGFAIWIGILLFIVGPAINRSLYKDYVLFYNSDVIGIIEDGKYEHRGCEISLVGQSSLYFFQANPTQEGQGGFTLSSVLGDSIYKPKMTDTIYLFTQEEGLLKFTFYKYSNPD